MALSDTGRRVLIAGIATAALLLYAASPPLCLRAWIGDGIAVPVCPDGRPHQEIVLAAEGWVRGKPGQVRLSTVARYTTSAADSAESTPVRRFSAELALAGPDGKEVPLEPTKGWATLDDHSQVATVAVPELPDGDYRLIARVK